MPKQRARKGVEKISWVVFNWKTFKSSQKYKERSAWILFIKLAKRKVEFFLCQIPDQRVLHFRKTAEQYEILQSEINPRSECKTKRTVESQRLMDFQRKI